MHRIPKYSREQGGTLNRGQTQPCLVDCGITRNVRDKRRSLCRSLPSTMSIALAGIACLQFHRTSPLRTSRLRGSKSNSLVRPPWENSITQFDPKLTDATTSPKTPDQYEEKPLFRAGNYSRLVDRESLAAHNHARGVLPVPLPKVEDCLDGQWLPLRDYSRSHRPAQDDRSTSTTDHDLPKGSNHHVRTDPNIRADNIDRRSLVQGPALFTVEGMLTRG